MPRTSEDCLKHRRDAHESLTGRAVGSYSVDESTLEEAILLALRRSSGSKVDELAEAAGLPRTNFGQRSKNRLREPLESLLAQQLIDEEHGRDQLTETGRRTLAERFDEMP